MKKTLKEQLKDWKKEKQQQREEWPVHMLKRIDTVLSRLTNADQLG